MTTQVTSMSAANEPPSQPRLPYWLGIVFPVVISASICFAVTFVINRLIMPVVVTLAAAAGIGLIAGFVVRQTLRNRARIVQGATALAALIVGLLMLGLMTNGQTGIGPLDNSSSPNWRGLALVVLAATTAWLALRAWRPGWRIRRPQPTERARPTLGERAAGWRQDVQNRVRAAWQNSALYRGINHANETLERARAWSLRDNGRARIRLPRLSFSLPFIQNFKDRFSKLPAPAPARPRKAKAQPQPRITFTGAIEHRCPYCLELVEPNDPRGVKICEICHTYHHADCWDITGMCQIPHHHTEIKVAD